MADFPQGWFFIRNSDSGKVLDVYRSGIDPGTQVILWDRNESSYDNQLWKYEQGFLINKNSGLVLEVPGYESGGHMRPDTGLVQGERRDKPYPQTWAYNHQHLMPYDPKVCISGRNGDVSTPGTRAVVDILQFGNVSQQWMLDLL